MTLTSTIYNCTAARLHTVYCVRSNKYTHILTTETNAKAHSSSFSCTQTTRTRGDAAPGTCCIWQSTRTRKAVHEASRSEILERRSKLFSCLHIATSYIVRQMCRARDKRWPAAMAVETVADAVSRLIRSAQLHSPVLGGMSPRCLVRDHTH